MAIFALQTHFSHHEYFMTAEMHYLCGSRFNRFSYRSQLGFASGYNG